MKYLVILLLSIITWIIYLHTMKLLNIPTSVFAMITFCLSYLDKKLFKINGQPVFTHLGMVITAFGTTIILTIIYSLLFLN